MDERVPEEVEEVPERHPDLAGVLPVHDDEVQAVCDNVPCAQIVVLRHGRKRGQLVHEPRGHPKLTPCRRPLLSETLPLGRQRLGRTLSSPTELEDPLTDPVDQTHLRLTLSRCREEIAQTLPSRRGLERGENAVHLEPAEKIRDMSREGSSGRVREREPALVVGEPSRVSGDARELEDPLRSMRSRPK